eukprot:CAMPEP_0202836620 /NCGR_PEP_ID=MMETSP1389-20130828/42422_1 /ASSEMBLY_ACC=CAM_ASM_000865 /TAXON_ID=302021 /ORGANISM="Rhodomonas sp., Strain CCMP768" /LENGTH=105 /DNA_ID=CAMNT_0049512487 /DNA_START=235 /DNA_END=553 /DNA_ORIENTATION=-
MSDIASAKSALGTESDAATLSEGSSHGVIGAAVGEMSSQRKSKTDSSFKDRQGAPQFSDWWIVNAARDPPRVLDRSSASQMLPPPPMTLENLESFLNTSQNVPDQ